MSGSETGLATLQRVLIECVTAADPVAALRERLQRDGAALDPEVRAWLAAVDSDGLRLTGLLVAKLRCERIARGDPRQRERMERDPAAFAADFGRYRAAVPPTAVFPADEAAAFAEFLRR